MPNKNYIMSIEQIKTSGYAELTCPASLTDVALQAMEKWQRVFALQPHLKEKTRSARNVGLVTPNTYHFTYGELALLHELALRLDGHPRRMVFELIEASEALWKGLAPLVLGYAQTIEREASLRRFVEEVEWGKNSWIIEYRFDEPNGEVDGVLRLPKVASQGLAIHVTETDAGLQHLGLNARWQDTLTPNGNLIITPGLQLQHRTKGEVRGLCERAVSTEKSAFLGRHTITCLIPLRMSPSFDEVRAGKQLTDHDEGFNYTMPYGEFANLFSYRG